MFNIVSDCEITVNNDVKDVLVRWTNTTVQKNIDFLINGIILWFKC